MRCRAEEEEDHELGAPVMDSTRKQIKWVFGGVEEVVCESNFELVEQLWRMAMEGSSGKGEELTDSRFD